MQSELFMVKLGFDFVVKLKGFATVSQKVLECNFMLMSSQMLRFSLNMVANGNFGKKTAQQKKGSISFGWPPLEKEVLPSFHKLNKNVSSAVRSLSLSL